MARTEAPESLQSHQSTGTRANLSREDLEHLDVINRSLSHMRNLHPSDPYILTIPQDTDRSYRHPDHVYARQWLDRTPFEDGERESLQYLTWRFHEPGPTNIFVQETTRPISMDNSIGNGSVRSGGTGASTPAGVEQKKRKTMTFGAYKLKMNCQTPDPDRVREKAAQAEGAKAATSIPASKSEGSGPLAGIQTDQKVLTAIVDGLKGPHQPSPRDAGSQGAEDKELKRKREDSKTSDMLLKQESGQSSADSPRAKTEDVPPAAKKLKASALDRRIPTPPHTAKSSGAPSSSATEPTTEPAADLGLPPRLSPLRSSSDEELQGAVSEGQGSLSALPPRLSPTLPADVEASLRQDDLNSPSELSIASETSPARPVHDESTAKHKSVVPKNGFRATSSSPLPSSQGTQGPRPPSSALSKAGRSSKAPEQPKTLPSNDVAKSVRSRCLVKLKFRKSKRENVKRILKMPRKPGIPVAGLNAENIGAANDKNGGPKAGQKLEDRNAGRVKGVAQKLTPSQRKANRQPNTGVRPEKRSHPEESEEDEPLRQKRQPEQPSRVLQKPAPSTPVLRQNVHSPASTQKSQSQTTSSAQASVKPPKESSAPQTTKRGLGGVATNTPSRVIASPAVNGTSHDTPAQPRPLSRDTNLPPGPKTERQEFWESEQKRLETVGRELKHAATDHLQSLAASNSPSASTHHQTLAAINSVESLLTYMLAFASADAASLAAAPKQNPRLRTWRTLGPFFAFVKRSCDPYPDLQGLVAHLAVVVHAHMLRVAPCAAAAPDPSGLDSSATLLLRASAEADAKLDPDALADRFPNAWAGRTTGVPEPEALLDPSARAFAGVYKLPVGVQTGPVAGVRAGLAVLTEWIRARGGEFERYESRVRLEG